MSFEGRDMSGPNDKQAAAALSRRERQIMDIVYGLGEATAAQVREAMPDPPTDAAVRATLRILVDKGHLAYEHDGPRYLYSPTVPRDEARRSALRHLVTTFFDGSTEGAMAALLDLQDDALSEAERRRLRAMIERAAEEGR
jgi:predicted transcriptional regulator